MHYPASFPCFPRRVHANRTSVPSSLMNDGEAGWQRAQIRCLFVTPQNMARMMVSLYTRVGGHSCICSVMRNVCCMQRCIRARRSKTTTMAADVTSVRCGAGNLCFRFGQNPGSTPGFESSLLSISVWTSVVLACGRVLTAVRYNLKTQGISVMLC